jgi:Cu(I)/Ag(I) efflux system membrane protein CusA/SilA
MIESIVHYSIKNRFLVLLLAVLLAVWGVITIKQTPLDAIPDLSDIQVIVKTSYPGQAPQVVEDQVTYPLTTAMLAVPGAVNVRGYSFFGDSYVYIIFEDGTDLYWARSRVLEYLSQVTPNLPSTARAALGPDATGVGWVYEYALVDRTGEHDLSQLRSIQDWFLKYELQTVNGVSEVATIGGMVKQYQVVIDPDKLRAYSIPLEQIKKAIQNANLEVGGSVIEMAEAEYMVRSSGYIKSIEDIETIPLAVSDSGTPVLLGDLADVSLGPQMRRGIAELNGEGEVVGGVIIMRWGENALKTIKSVKQKLNDLKASLPDGVEIVETYDRSALIERAVDNLRDKLTEEFIAVVLICALFLFHFRSSLVVLISLPLGILIAFIVMAAQGVNANIMSLGGIAIAVGAMVDATIVMIENVHKHAEKEALTNENRWQLVAKATGEVGPPLFFSLLIITLSFLPVFTLEGQEGRMFTPLALTKTYAMAGAACLAITIIPVLIGFFVRGRITPEKNNPVNRLLVAGYQPFLQAAIKKPKIIVAVALVAALTGIWPLTQLGSEFMPELNEGDLLYMPSTFPGISIGKAQEILQQTDRMIKTLPEVDTVFGKVGRAETATDPAPLTMIETTIRLKPKAEWRAGMTMEKIKAELDDLVDVPGISNVWIMPIKNRLDMLATGIKTPLGIKVSGPDLSVIANIGERIEKVLKPLEGTASVYAERVSGARFIDINIDRKAAARFGLNVSDVQNVVRTAVGGMNVTQSVEGLERYPVNLRYPRDVRDSAEKLKLLPIVTPTGAHIPLGEVASIKITDGPGMVRSENARLNGWIYVDIDNIDLGSYVDKAKRVVKEKVVLPAGYSVAWSGQFEYMERTIQRMKQVVPVTFLIIVFLLYLNFRRFEEVLIILASLPFALVGGLWLIYGLGYNLSVAVAVGFIALAGVTVEIGVLLMEYLNRSYRHREQLVLDLGRAMTPNDLSQSVIEGALLRIRPILMTVASTVIGLLPIMLGAGTGSEIMQRIAAPMVGGMVSSTILLLLVIPAIFVWWKLRLLQQKKY